MAISLFRNDINIPVILQDQITRPYDLYFKEETGVESTLAATTSIGDRTITLADTTGFTAGSCIQIISDTTSAGRFYCGGIVSVASPNLTLDTPLDFEYSIGDRIFETNKEMNVNGATTPRVFTVEGVQDGSNVQIDITRILIQITTEDPPVFSAFGDIANGLTNGVVLSHLNGYRSSNLWNAKQNSDLANLAYDYTTFSQTNPSIGVNGIAVRYTFAGQDKHGVAIRLKPNEHLRVIVQDNLSALTSFRVMGQGHETLPGTKS